MRSSYRIIYPRGDRTKLTTAMVMDYEEDEYDLASSQKFEFREDAIEHMQTLANLHNLNCEPRPQKLLD